MNGDKMTIETTDLELKFTRVFAAPRQLVFDAFTDCEHLQHWWGPRNWPITRCQMDFREGGAWFYCMQGPRGELACGSAVYQRIERPKQLTYEDRFTDEEGKVDLTMPSALVTYEFSQTEGGTQVVGRTKYEEPSDLQKVLDMGMIAGMTETLDRLEEHLQAMQS